MSSPITVRLLLVTLLGLVSNLHIRPSSACSCALPPTFGRVFCRSPFAAIVQITSGPVRILTHPNTTTLTTDSVVSSESEPLVYQLNAAASHHRPSIAVTAPISPARVIALSHFSQLPTNDRLTSAQLLALSKSARTSRSQTSVELEEGEAEDKPADKMPADEAVTFSQRRSSLVSGSIKAPIELINSSAARNAEFAALRNQPIEREEHGELLVSTFYRAKVLHAFHLSDSLRNRLTRNKQQIRLWTQLKHSIGPVTSCHLELNKDQHYVVWASLDESEQHVTLSFCSVVGLDWLKQTRQDQLQHMITTGLRCR
jgi:hypothetical protein